MKVIVKQVKSSTDSGDRINRTLHALGLGRINKKKSFDISNNAALKGQLKAVGHLLEIREVK